MEDLRSSAVEELGSLIRACADGYQRSLDIEKGELVRVVWIRTPEEQSHNRLLMLIHHLAVDGVSWRILLEDLDLLLTGMSKQEKVDLGSKSSSYRQWYEGLERYGKTGRLLDQRAYWQRVVESYRSFESEREYRGDVKLGDMGREVMRLGAEQTRRLVQEVPRVYHTEINDILLCALVWTLREWSGRDKVVIGLEGHGREGVIEGVDTSRTVGWFTSLYPVLMEVGGVDGAGNLIKTIKEQLRRIPDKGLGYGVLRYINKEESLRGLECWDIVFNYLGQSDNVVRESGLLSGAEESAGAMISEEYVMREKLSVNGMIRSGELVLNWSYSTKHYGEATVRKLVSEYSSRLELLIAHCLEQQRTGTVYTPWDYGLSEEVTYEELDRFLEEPLNGKPRKDGVEGLYRLSGLQQGMLFHGLYDENAGGYIEQLGCDLTGLDPLVFSRSWDHVMKGHSILRSAFYYDQFNVPVQCVYSKVELPLEVLDYRDKRDEEQRPAIREYEELDKLKGFDFKTAPLMRVALMRLGEDRYRMLWTWHHILFDGWSLPVLMEEFLGVYELLSGGP